MKRLLFTLTILLAGCTIPCEQKPCYQEISKQDFINLVHHHASNDEAIVAVVYVGSDADTITSTATRLALSTTPICLLQVEGWHFGI